MKRISIANYAEQQDKSCDFKASNGKVYHFLIVRHPYSVAWMAQITGEQCRMCHHPEPHVTASGAKKNAIKFLEAILKERGALNTESDRWQSATDPERKVIESKWLRASQERQQKKSRNGKVRK